MITSGENQTNNTVGLTYTIDSQENK